MRDSALNSSNDLKVMFESFEMALDRAGKALRITVPVTASGVSRAAV